jgi:predicted amidohydrolase YtcJ
MVAVAAAATVQGSGASPAEAPADFIINNAKIYTADEKRSIAEAVAVRDGRIVYVGTNAGVQSLVDKHTRVQSAGGRLLLPGLFDSHVHATGIVDLDVCDLKSEAKSLSEISDFVRGCIDRYKVPEGAWVVVRQWNPTSGNTPDEKHPTFRAALDLASMRHPVELLGNDAHHGAFNSVALARAKNAAGQTVGFSTATLAGDLHVYQHLIGVDAVGEPNGTVNEDARRLMAVPGMMDLDFAEVMKLPERVPQRLNSVGITGIMDPAVGPDMLRLYDALDKSGKLTVRTTFAQFFDPDTQRTASGEPDWNGMLSTAKSVRAKYERNVLIKANFVKLFADGVIEGNPYAVPPTPPEVAGVRPYLQPIFKSGSDGKLTVVGYVDTAEKLCVNVREHLGDYESPDAVAEFTRMHGYHPAQCKIPTGQLQHDRKVILEFVKRFHVAGFGVHIHAIGEMAVRTAVDAIEAARRSDGVSTTHDALAHIQLVPPDDVQRAGRDHLYLVFTYSWVYADPAYDMSVIPFIDRVQGGDDAALHPKNGYYETHAWPVRSMQQAGAILLAGSDAPVNTHDPQPFVNMAFAVTRQLPGHIALNPSLAIPIRDVIDAYTRNGAAYLYLDKEAGSIEIGKSADLIVVDQDILALADSGNAGKIAQTKVLQTYFRGKLVYGQPVNWIP